MKGARHQAGWGIPSLAQIFFGQFADLFRARRAARRLGRRAPRLEILEPRLLLSADLVGSVEWAAPANPLLPGDDIHASVVVRNLGDKSTAAFDVRLYASADAVLDGSDLLLDSASVTGGLRAGNWRNIGLDFELPESLRPGGYHLLAMVDPGNKVQERNEANNVGVGPAFEVRWMFGSVPGHQGDNDLTLRDADGTRVHFDLSGPGSGEVKLDGSQWDVVITGSTASTILTITTDNGGNDRVSLDDIQISGPLQALVAPTMDLTGTLAIGGALGAGLLIGSANGALITAPSLQGLNVFCLEVQGIAVLGDLTDSQIRIGGGNLGDLVIGGDMDSSRVSVGQNPVDGIYDNGNDTLSPTGAIRSVTIHDEMTSDSRITAANLPAKASVDGRQIPTANDPRFVRSLNSNHAPVGVADAYAAVEDTALAVNAASGVLANDTDADGNPLTVTLVSAPPASQGTLALSANGSFTFTPAANFNGPATFTYKANDGAADSNVTTVTINVAAVNDAPTAAGNTYAATEDVPLSVSAALGVLANDTDPDGNLLTAILVAAPLAAQGTLALNANGSFTFTPAANFNGQASFTYQARDGAADSNVATVTINVAAMNDAPLAFGAVVATQEDTPVSGTLQATDADSPALVYSVVANGAKGTALITNAATGAFTYTPNPGASGADSFAFRASDGTAFSNVATVEVAIAPVNDAPVLGTIGNRSVNEGATLSLVASASDPDADTQLTFSLAGAPAGASIHPETGLFRWTPTEAQGPGSFTFDVVVTDDGATVLSDFETITVTVNEVNLAPVLAVIGSKVVDEGATLSFTASAVDPDLPVNALAFSLDEGAPAGAAIDPVTGVFSWATGEDQGSGDYLFTVRVTDSGTPARSDFETIAVHVNEVNQAPVLAAIGDRSVNEGAMLSFVATAADLDAPLNTLTFSLAGAPGGATIHPETGLFRWTPTEAHGPGAYTFTVVVTDDGAPALSDSETITVTVGEVNLAPVLALIGGKSVDEGSTLAFTASAVDPDLPGNALTYSLDVGAPDGAAIDPASGHFSWTPGEDQGPGDYLFTVRVSDDGAPVRSDFEIIAVHVNEVNQAPVLAGIGDRFTNEGVPLTFVATAADGDSPANTLTFSLAGAPAGATIHPETGLFSWTPGADQGGLHTFDVVVTDDGTPVLSDIETVTFAVLAGPSLAISDVTVTEGADGETTLAVFTVTLIAPLPDQTVAVAYFTENGSAAGQMHEHEGGDFGAVSFELAGALVFEPGVTVQTIEVPIFGDFEPEDDEAFYVNLFAPTNARLADAQGTGTIVNDDPFPVPEVFISDAVLFEGSGGTTTAQFVVSLSDIGFNGEVRISFSTADGTALAGEDYLAASGVITFMPGETEQVIQVQVIGDTLVEPDEFFSVQLSALPDSEVNLGNDQAIATILDDDAPARLSISDAQQFEGDVPLDELLQELFGLPPEILQELQEILSGASPAQVLEIVRQFVPDLQAAVFTVSLTGAVSGPVSVDFATADGSAMGVEWQSFPFPPAPSAAPNHDYVVTQDTLHFAPTQRSQQILVLINSDRLLEFDESFFVDLSNAQGAEIVDGQGEGTILTDDGIRILGTQVREEDGVALFMVMLSSPVGSAVSVDYASSDGSATAGTDYTAVAGTLVFAAGETVQQIEVPILADGEFEGLEEFFVTLTNASGAPLVGGGQAVGQISDFPTLSVADTSVLEGDDGVTEMVFTLSLSSPSDVPVMVEFMTESWTASSGIDYHSDYDFMPTQVVINPGESSVQVAVQVFGDTEFERDEQIRLTVLGSDLPGFEGQQLSALGTILNDDEGMLVTVGDASVLEGGGGEEQFALFTVTLSGTLPTQPLQLLYQTVDGDAKSFNDYEPVFGAIEFAPGETEKTIEVRVFGDFEREGNEQFYMQVFDPGLPNTLVGGPGVGTIQDDDGPQVFISGGTVLEGDAGLRTIQFQVFLSEPVFEGEVQIAFSTADGSAIGGEDYLARSGTLVFLPGETEQVIEIRVIGDDLEEADESFFVRLEPVPGFEVVFANDTGEGLILDDDGPARLLISDVVLEEGGLVWDPEFFLQVASFTVSLRGEVSGPVTVDFATSDGTATGVLWDGTLPGPAGSDYATTSGTLSFGPGETSKTIEVLIRPDISLEPDETFFVTLSNAVGAAISDGEGTGLILNDDELPQLYLYGATVSDDADTSVVFTVQLSAPTDVPVTVEYATVEGSATADVDYTAVSGTLTIAPGETVGVIEVPIISDAQFEGVESFSVVLGNSTNAVVVQPEALGIIDDRPTLSVEDLSVVEGSDGEVNTALFTVRLSKPVPVEVTANYFTEGDSAQAFGDFMPVSGQLVFAAGETEQTIAVEVFGDSQFEFDEQFRLQLYDLVNAQLPADFHASATIVNDDSGRVLSVSDAGVVMEGNGESVFATFTVTLTSVGTPPDEPVEVFYETGDFSAFAFEDYLPVSDMLTFFPGQTEQTIEVMIVGDDRFESSEEQFFLRFFDQGRPGLLFARSQGMATIVDDDVPPPPPTPEVFISDAVALEGNDEGGVIRFTLSLMEPVFDGEVRIAFSTADGTALAGEDYEAMSGTVTFMPGELEQLIEIQLIGDLLEEPDEFFSVHLAPVPDSELEVIFANDQASGTILDDDGPTRLAISDAQVYEGDTTLEELVDGVLVDFDLQQQLFDVFNSFPPEQRTQAVFELLQEFGFDVSMAVFDVSLTGNASGTVAVDYATADGTAQGVVWDLGELESILFPPAASPDQDYIAGSGTLTFHPGQRHQSVFVLISPDRLLEPDEGFFVNLSNAQGAEIVDGQGEGTILTDDGIRIFGTQVREEDGVALFTVMLSSPVGSAVSVDYASSDGSATAGLDYTAVAGTLVFAAGETVQQIEVPILADGEFEGLEEFFVTLTNASGAPLVGGGQAAGQISDFPRLSVADTSVLEGDNGVTEAFFTVSIATPISQDVELSYRVIGITAEEGIDFEPVFDSVTLHAGETSVQLAVQVYGDTEFESDEQFALDAFIFMPGFEDQFLSAVGTIVNDDTGILINGVSVDEGDAGVSFAVFTVALSQPAAGVVTVDYRSEDATAQAGSDYEPVSGTLTFEPGETVKTISVAISGDTEFEQDEHFLLRLFNPVNAGLTGGEETVVSGVIANDDPGIVLADTTVTEGDNGYRAAVFTISLQGAAPGATASVHFTTADNSATAGADYVPISGTITFGPGETTKQFTIPVRGDFAPEQDEYFIVLLSDAVGAAIATESASALIHDNDPGLRIDDVMAYESDSAIFTVILTSPLPEQEVWVDFYTLDGTAQGGADYQPMSGSLYFAPGQTVNYVMVPLYNDFSYEPDETFSVRLANASGAAISREEGVGTILNDDTQPALEFYPQEFAFEGDDGTSELAVRVRLTSPAGAPVSVDYVTGDADAIGGQDYVAAAGTLTFQPGETEQFVRLEIIGDRLFETTASFGLSFYNPVNANLLYGNQVVVTIFDNDPLPRLSVSNATVLEGNAGITDAAFVLTLSEASGASATVQFSAGFGGSATAGIDFLATSGSVTFDPGETEKTVVVPVLGDLNLELDEYFYLDVFNAQNVDLTGYGTAFILNDDPLTVSTGQTEYAVDEGSALSFQARIENSELPQDFVAFSLEGYPAGAAIDFFTGAFGWVPGEDQGPGVYTFDVVANLYPLGLVDRETVTVTVNEVAGTQTSVSIDNAIVTEGDSGTALLTFYVWLDAPATDPVTVDYFTSPGTATEGLDYAAASGQLVFAPGQIDATISVAVYGDVLPEAQETLYVSLANPVNTSIHPLRGQGTGFIANDDLPRFAINDVSVFEGSEGGTTTATFTIARLGGSFGENSIVDFGVFGGSAAPGIDFVPVAGTLFFGADQASQDIVVTINGDAVMEGDESFFVQVFGAANAFIVDSIGSGTIRDDDALPPGSLLVNDVTAFEGTGGAAGATFTVLRTRGDTIGVTSTVQYALIGGTAAFGSDFLPSGGTLVFGPGEMFQTFTVDLNPDAQPEEDETFTVQLFAPTGAVIFDGQGTGTILNDDPAADSAPLAADGAPPEVEIAWTEGGADWDPEFSLDAGANFADFYVTSA